MTVRKGRALAALLILGALLIGAGSPESRQGVEQVLTALGELDLVSSAAAADSTPSPVAHAGLDHTVAVDALVQLDGSASTNQASGLLTYSWRFVSVAAGSIAVLSSTSAVKPSFTANVAGNYAVELVVSAGTLASAPDTVIISTENSAPAADAGRDQTVAVGETVRLDASNSWDDDGDPLSYFWSITSAPAGSSAAISDPTALRPTFVPDLAGVYTIELVADDGAIESAPDTMKVSTVNTAPVPDAGPDQRVAVGATVTLDASRSFDVDGEPINFSWSLLSRPSGSAAALANPASAFPTFTADRAGVYVAQVIVTDPSGEDDGNNGHGNDPDHDDCSNPGKGKGNHAAENPTTGDCGYRAIDTVVITTAPGNTAPVADAGRDRNVGLGEIVTLDGAGSSDVDGNALTYRWSVIALPDGAADTLSDPTAIRPTLLIGATGTYVLQLVVSDGATVSLPDTVVLSTLNSAPIANAGPDRARRLA
jgi:hypothetical protein